METSHRLGFLQTEAYQLSSLGRAQCQAGDYAAGVATLRTSIDKAEATGDVRLAALARVHLGRALRAEGDLVGARAALESADRVAPGGRRRRAGAARRVPPGGPRRGRRRTAGAQDRLVALLTEAREQDAAHVEVFALDALARLAADSGRRRRRPASSCDRADRRMEAASHFITDHDRTDAHWVTTVGVGLGAR